MSYETLLIETNESVTEVTLNRPDVLNAMNNKMLRELGGALAGADADPDIRAVIITGAGRAFSAGRDANEIGEADHVSGSEVWNLIERMGTAVMAAVNGLCYTGALSMLLCFDVVVASSEARFADTHAKYGMRHGGGSTQRLRDAVGRLKAKEMMFTCEPIDAYEAHRLGIVNHVVAPDELLSVTREIAAKIASNDANTISATKHLINQGAIWGTAIGLELEQQEYRAQRMAISQGEARLEINPHEGSR